MEESGPLFAYMFEFGYIATKLLKAYTPPDEGPNVRLSAGEYSGERTSRWGFDSQTRQVIRGLDI